MVVNWEEMQVLFEDAAIKKGYCFDRDTTGKYVDIYLQEAWELFCLIKWQSL